MDGLQLRLAVFPCCVSNGMYGKESVCSIVRPESAGHFLLYLQFSDSSLARIVVGWNCGIFQEVEYVIPAFCESLAKPLKVGS